MLLFQVEFARVFVGPDQATVEKFLNADIPLTADMASRVAAIARAALAGFAFRAVRSSHGRGNREEQKALDQLEAAEDALPANLQAEIGPLMRKLAMANAGVVTAFLESQLERKTIPLKKAS